MPVTATACKNWNNQNLEGQLYGLLKRTVIRTSEITLGSVALTVTYTGHGIANSVHANHSKNSYFLLASPMNIRINCVGRY